MSQVNPIISNQAINLVCYQSETLELPISIYADRKDLFVKFMATQLTNLVSNGENQRLASKENILSVVLGYQGEFNFVSQYACLLQHYHLKEGTYTGNIVVKNKPSGAFDTTEINPIIALIPVNIQVLKHPLNEVTKWTKPYSTEKYTTQEMLTNLYEFIYLRASYYTKNLDDTYAVNYKLQDNRTKILSFRTDDMKQLPFGAKCFVQSKTGSTNRQLDIFNSTLNGYSDKDQIHQISQDNKPVSYCMVKTGDLPTGEYIYFAEYTIFGDIKQTPYGEFRI